MKQIRLKDKIEIISECSSENCPLFISGIGDGWYGNTEDNCNLGATFQIIPGGSSGNKTDNKFPDDCPLEDVVQL